MDLVSIIVPVYNAEKFVARCVGSLTGQSYGNLEIILVNDGSRDASGAICLKLQTEDPRITYIEQDNLGAGGARNMGLGVATGEYVLFVDADDWLAKDAVETFISVAKKEGSDFVIMEAMEETATGLVYKPEKKLEQLSSGEILDALLVNAISNHVTRRLFKRSLWDGVKFPEKLIYQDLYVLPHVAIKAKKIIYRAQPVYFYNRINANANTSYLRDFRVFNRYSKVLAYAEHEKVGRELGDEKVITWAVNRGLHETVKAFCVECAYPALTDSQKEELKGYAAMRGEGISNLSLKDRLLLKSALKEGFLCKIYGCILRLLHILKLR